MLIREMKVTMQKKDVKVDERTITMSNVASTYAMAIYQLEGDIDYRERFYAIYLSRKNRVMGHHEVGVGGIGGVMCDPKIVFGVGLTTGASQIILVHNHPSGNLKPSHSDIDLTKRCVEAGKILEMPVIDHVIVSGVDGWEHFSFADEGML